MRTFCQIVRVKAKLKRDYKDSKADTPGLHYWKTVPLPEAREGLIIGKRTLSDGVVEYMPMSWEYPDDGQERYYNPKRHFTAYLVVFNIRENPVYVAEEDIL